MNMLANPGKYDYGILDYGPDFGFDASLQTPAANSGGERKSFSLPNFFFVRLDFLSAPSSVSSSLRMG